MTQTVLWHKRSVQDVLSEHATSLDEGLAHEEVTLRSVEYGANRLEEANRRGPWRTLLSQFTDFMVLVLIGAAVIAIALGEPYDAIAILAIVFLNGLLGFFQDYRAEQAMQALQALAAPHARVRRAGKILTVPAFDLVPGDVVFLEQGAIVPADLRIVELAELQIDESMLTGESAPVVKSVHVISETMPTHDQKNMAFKGTVVTRGRATGVVVRVGMSTEIGRIAALLKREVEPATPLQRKLTVFARRLAFVVIGLCAIIFVFGLLRGEKPVLMFLTALSLAVAAIPEALPAVITVALSLGARAMSRQKALVRKLPAVEALGSVTVICSDKTGTLTENRMQAQEFRVHHGARIQTYQGIPPRDERDENWEKFLLALALNNDVVVSDQHFVGDPTEVALMEAAVAAGLDLNVVRQLYPRVAELSFTSERGLMSTVHRKSDGRTIVLTKGAPEYVFALCEDVGLTEPESVQSMAAQGMRVLALAYREIGDQDVAQMELNSVERGLKYLGLIGLIDPPRESAAESVRLCHAAGIRVAMITGDHPATARAIAHRLGSKKTIKDQVITGRELAALSDDELQITTSSVAVYARMDPEQKIRIVKALQANGDVVAMTGDGVNDSPALKRADVGVAMGKGGTDVAREAAHIILLDDNFSSIVGAVREGRRIYDNIRKFVRFALSGNSGEIWTLFCAPLFGLPTPLLPIQILWINLVTDGLPGLSLAVEPEERNIMHRPPRSPRESIFARGLWQHSVWVGVLTAAVTLGSMAWAFHAGHPGWQTIAFTVLTMTQMGHVLAIRSERESIFTIGFLSNTPLLFAVLTTFILHLAVLYVPMLSAIFKTTPLSMVELLLCFVASSSVFVAVEIEKLFRRRSEQKSK
ncbi:MAG: cation-translocating P-type ATPase [Bdellovibrionales bacterium]|nr:cation-translocating P-type ATPase [Bdellovibrionales bacterium]